VCCIWNNAFSKNDQRGKIVCRLPDKHSYAWQESRTNFTWMQTYSTIIHILWHGQSWYAILWNDASLTFFRTLLFFPLSPFFVLFCNVVYSANLDDYALMAAVTKEIMRFVEKHPAIAEIHKLFSAFLALAEPLIHNQPHGRSLPIPDAATSGSEPTISTRMTTQYHSHPVSLNISQENGISIPDQGIVTQDGLVDPDEDLLWDLIDSQPWLGWMGSDGLTGNPITN